MNIFRRLIFAIYGLIIALISAAAILMIAARETMGQSYFSSLVSQLYQAIFYGDMTVKGIIITILLILFIISLMLVFKGTGEKRDREPIIKDTEGGQIEISLETFESIAVTTLKKITNAKDCTARVRKIEDGVTVFIKMTVIPDVNIPELGQRVQSQVSKDIEAATDVKVSNVKVRVENISNTFRSKVE